MTSQSVVHHFHQWHQSSCIRDTLCHIASAAALILSFKLIICTACLNQVGWQKKNKVQALIYCIWQCRVSVTLTVCLTHYYCSSSTLQQLANSLLLGCGDSSALHPSELSVQVDVVASDAEVDKITPATRKKSYSASGLNCALLVWLIWVICSCM